MPRFLLFLSALLLPGLAFADSLINPGGSGNAWNIYAMGNGEALAKILESVKLLISPDAGNSGYGTVLLFMALLGFLVLAVKAGFNPSQNLGKMAGYILMVWMVVLTTTHIKANVRVYDPVSNFDTVVPRVPAMVAIPASVVSEIGVWITRKMEEVFVVPSELTLTAGASEGLGGGFNLFGRMMADSDKFVITNPDLKRSLAAYATDCVVPAIAMGRMNIRQDLLQSTSMVDSLGKAEHNSLLTKFFPTSGRSLACATSAADTAAAFAPLRTTSAVATDTAAAADATPSTGADSRIALANYANAEKARVAGAAAKTGAITLSCRQAYDCLYQDLQDNAEALFHGSAQAWSDSGVMVPFETAMQVAITEAGGGGANAYANYGKPQGYILQKSLMSTMRGSFRQAAVQTGNNEVLMAASVAQAEQAQRSSWWTAAEVFKNLTGYIYTTLQAFLFGIVPIIIIALMIPGLGGKIAVNYFQLLIWLALWTPLLAIVNYLITLFGQQDIYSVWSQSGGPTMQTEWALSEKTNNLVIAAQFLGTSVPILALGLVKGAMAFTEFVSHGIGSSFAMQAGQTASSGNLSMGNISMDQVSANKYNTAMSSSVGFQDTMAYSNAGAMGQVVNQGGAAGTRDGGAVGRSLGGSQSYAHGAQVGSDGQARSSSSQGKGGDISHGGGLTHTSSDGANYSDNLANAIRSGDSDKIGHALDEAHNQGQTYTNAQLATIAKDIQSSYDIGASAPQAGKKGGGTSVAAAGAPGAPGAPAAASAPGGALGAMTPGASAGTKGGASIRNTGQDAFTKQEQASHGTGEKTAASHDVHSDHSNDHVRGGGHSLGLQTMVSAATAANNSLTARWESQAGTGVSTSENMAYSDSMNRGWTAQDAGTASDYLGMGGARDQEAWAARAEAFAARYSETNSEIATQYGKHATAADAMFDHAMQTYGQHQKYIDGVGDAVDASLGHLAAPVDYSKATADEMSRIKGLNDHGYSGVVGTNDAGRKAVYDAADSYNPFNMVDHMQKDKDGNWVPASSTAAQIWTGVGAGANLLNLASIAGVGPGSGVFGGAARGAMESPAAAGRFLLKASGVGLAGAALWSQYNDPNAADDRMEARFGVRPDSAGEFLAMRGLLMITDAVDYASFGIVGKMAYRDK